MFCHTGFGLDAFLLHDLDVHPIFYLFLDISLLLTGLSFSTDEQSLKEAFNSFGNVVEVNRCDKELIIDAARVITDRDTGRSRGFGFVNFDSDASASEALSGMDGQVC
ncbi:hypothetical protein BHE74_00030096 [Ensete ventricosum]|uniref:Uncharacterized protein n=1 Tax=Ensete ventricosum TaxID=4639 RepID=A0A444DDN4_ENSVE|nr:hypothetical protein B296_00010201 [Ensete ventricosum]RWV96283.1 hypothetical protein GW17_00041018 [Ensete ventricosum]RWW62755.1 hypothetical protein BHE74_00030096 [Ensete ventricosum]RZS04588.1 hypothetical protein BHM03_00034948 [Ensete ventricosum]